MSFDHSLFQREYAHMMTTRLGLPQDQALKLSAMASEAICTSNGGTKHYIQARHYNRAAIIEAYSGGQNVAALAQRFGMSAAKVRNIVR